jgi:hypothetical protein
MVTFQNWIKFQAFHFFTFSAENNIVFYSSLNTNNNLTIKQFNKTVSLRTEKLITNLKSPLPDFKNQHEFA